MDTLNTIQKPLAFSNEPSYKCPKCKDTGWEVYETSDGTEEVYGVPTMITYAKRCWCLTNNHNTDLTEFPTIYRDCDIYKVDWDCYSSDATDLKRVIFSFFNQFDKWESEGMGLYLWSKTPGSGKTFISACLSKSVMLRTQKSIKYVTPMTYMEKVKEGYNDRSLPDPSQTYRTCSLLILDDLGTQITTDWHMQELFKLIDCRASNRLPTIITSNYDISALNVDERIKSRLINSTFKIHMFEESIREKKANEKQERFINKIIGG